MPACTKTPRPARRPGGRRHRPLHEILDLLRVARETGQDFFLTAPEAADVFGVTRAGLDSMWRKGNLPPPRKFSSESPGSARGWLSSDVEAFISSRPTAPLPPAP